MTSPPGTIATTIDADGTALGFVEADPAGGFYVWHCSYGSRSPYHAFCVGWTRTLADALEWAERRGDGVRHPAIGPVSDPTPCRMRCPRSNADAQDC
jgi:hypothetical protein